MWCRSSIRLNAEISVAEQYSADQNPLKSLGRTHFMINGVCERLRTVNNYGIQNEKFSIRDNFWTISQHPPDRNHQKPIFWWYRFQNSRMVRDIGLKLGMVVIFEKLEDLIRSARIWLATIRLPNAGPTTGLKSAKSRHYERRLLADFRPVVGPAFGSRMVAKRFCADRGWTTSYQGVSTNSATRILKWGW